MPLDAPMLEGKWVFVHGAHSGNDETYDARAFDTLAEAATYVSKIPETECQAHASIIFRVAESKNAEKRLQYTDINLTDANEHVVRLCIVVDGNPIVSTMRIYKSVGGAICIKRDNGTFVRLTKDDEGSY